MLVVIPWYFESIFSLWKNTEVLYDHYPLQNESQELFFQVIELWNFVFNWISIEQFGKLCKMTIFDFKNALLAK